MTANACRESKTVKKITSYLLVAEIYMKGLGQKFDLNPTTLLVLVGLANHYSPNRPLIFPSQEFLATHLNISERSVIRAIKDLLSKNLIFKSKKGNGTNSNVYAFTNIFFEALDLSPEKCKNDSNKNDKKADSYHEQNHVNNTNNNKRILNFQRNEIEAPIHTSETTKKLLDEYQQVKNGSPLDFSYDEAKEYLDNLIPELRNSFFARKLREKWNL